MIIITIGNRIMENNRLEQCGHDENIKANNVEDDMEKSKRIDSEKDK